MALEPIKLANIFNAKHEQGREVKGDFFGYWLKPLYKWWCDLLKTRTGELRVLFQGGYGGSEGVANHSVWDVYI